MSGGQVGIDALRAVTEAFIEMDPVDLVLIPTDETLTESGGQSTVEGTPRPVQRFKLIPMTFDQRPTVTVAGVERLIDYHLLGKWDATVKVGDHWTDPDGTMYEVVALADGHGYETKALVQRHVPKGT